MPKKIKEYGTPEQIERIKQEIADEERMLNADDENKRSDIGYFAHSAKRLDVKETKAAIAHKKKMLERMTPTKLTGRKADKAYEVAKKLEGWIKENQIPAREENLGYEAGNDFTRAVDRQVKWTQTRVKVGDLPPMHPVQLHRHLMRRIDPSVPYKDFGKMRKR
jgi:hypothetical protein